MSDAAAFVILGIVAVAIGWPTWVWVAAFVLAFCIMVANVSD